MPMEQLELKDPFQQEVKEEEFKFNSMLRHMLVKLCMCMWVVKRGTGSREAGVHLLVKMVDQEVPQISAQWPVISPHVW